MEEEPAAHPQHCHVTKVLTDAQKRLASIDSELRGRLNKEYTWQVKQLEPLLQEQGRRVGQHLLEMFQPPPGPSAGLGRVASEAPSNADSQDDEDEWMPVWGSGLVINNLQGLSADDVLDKCRPYLDPVLNPFVDGLTEPFQQAATQATRKGVAVLLLSCAASLVVGFVAGSAWNRRQAGRKP